MGNWRRVWIVGTFPADQVEPLRAAFSKPENPCDDWPEYHPLLIGVGLASLGNWPAPVVNAVGNLYERDFSPEDVRDACERYVIPVAPGADLKIHCGGDYESAECVGTVTVADGTATLGKAEVKTLPEIPVEVVNSRFLNAVFGFGRTEER